MGFRGFLAFKSASCQAALPLKSHFQELFEAMGFNLVMKMTQNLIRVITMIHASLGLAQEPTQTGSARTERERVRAEIRALPL